MCRTHMVGKKQEKKQVSLDKYPVIFLSDPVIFRTNQVVFRRNSVLRTFLKRNFDKNGQKQTENKGNRQKQTKTDRNRQIQTKPAEMDRSEQKWTEIS